MSTLTDAILLAFCFLSVQQSSSGVVPCMPKDFGHGSVVCVCNATYCDTVEPETSLPPSSYSVYISSKRGGRLEKRTGNISSQGSTSGSAVVYSINRNVTYQTIIGFGGTFTDAAGMNIVSLSSAAKDNLMSSYFGPDGIEYSLGRIPIASNDFSTDVYSYDFTNGDTMLAKFTIAGYDHRYKLPLIDQAVTLSSRNVSLFASPWSPPGWMKTSNSMVGYGSVLPSMAKVYANYLARFLREYESFMFHGRLWGMTAQNAPSSGCTHGFPYQALCWTPAKMRDWISRDLAPSLKEYGYDHIKLMVVDEPREFLPYWVETFADNTSRAADYVSGFAVHWDPDGNQNTLSLDSTHAQFPDKFILSTEAFITNRTDSNNSVSLGNWENAERYIRSIITETSHWVSGWTDSNLALNTEGGSSWVGNTADSPVIVDKAKDVFYKQPMFYAIGHFSKFVPPGSVRVAMDYNKETAPLTPGVAFIRPDGSVVAVIVNLGDRPVGISIQDGEDVINYVMPEHSFQSFIWSK